MAVLTAELVREEVRAWLAENWDPDLTLAQWWDRLAESGWAVPTWPEEWYGKGFTRDLAAAVSEEIAAAGAVGPPSGLGILLAGPTIITHGTDEQKRRYLKPIINGQEAWCQLFSEPGAGSDLAGLQTRAERDGDEWVVNGQKVWTSGGQLADLGMLVARTDWDVPKHKGLTYFALPMDQPGVEVRPLREMTGRALFSEVFFTDARVSDDARIGELNGGWAVANTTLANERAGLGSGGSGALGGAFPGRKAGFLDRRAGDLAGGAPRGGGAGANVGSTRSGKLFMQLAKELGRDRDPVVRQNLAQLYTLNEIGRMTALRTKAARAAGRGPGPEANTAKLMMSRITRLSREVGLEILGPWGTLMGPDTPGGGAIQEMALFSPAPSIYGGSDEIQKNIIGERVLGLPKEPDPYRGQPFREVPRNG
ncbi:MAG TPA: acyl-CoA dehydrogenase family protein [Acidimicrobiia bacterium]|nr:acyl-CoA dehydrogenase family protein [Acidimicrobiia bacterium]